MATHSPLTYTKTGTAIQKFICETLIGSVVSVTIFCALQIFHIIPYVLSGIVLAGTYVFYQTAPVALITLLAASILLLNVYFLYRVDEGIKAATKTVRGEFEDAEVKIENKGKELKASLEPEVRKFAYFVTVPLIISTVINGVALCVLLNKAI